MIGATVSKIRLMTNKELKAEGWEGTPVYHIPTVIEFNNGTRIYASCDDEGNGPGALFGINKAGESIFISVEKK